MSEAIREPLWSCTSCGYKMDAVSSFDNDSAAPKEGDFSLCMKCAAPHTRVNGKWEPMSKADFDKLDRETKEELTKYQMTIIAVNRKLDRRK